MGVATRGTRQPNRPSAGGGGMWPREGKSEGEERDR
jgi:hypothetical protein